MIQLRDFAALLGFAAGLLCAGFERLAQFPDFLPVMQFGFALPVVAALVAVDFGHLNLLVSHYGKYRTMNDRG